MALGANVNNTIRKISVEEVLNSCTHGAGLVLSIVSFVVLLALSIRYGTAWHIAGCAIYGSTLICLYLASTLYHGIPLPRLKRLLKIFDHSAIYLLIAGTYTPFLPVNLRGGWGWSLLRHRVGMRKWQGLPSSSGSLTTSRSFQLCSISFWAG